MIKLQRNERIKEVKGYEGLYAVTTLGRIWSYHSNRWIKPYSDTSGYSRVRLCNKGQDTSPSLHRLVAIAFIPNPDGKPQVNHINGVKGDCKVSNLEWMTARENMQHSADTGLGKRNVLTYEERLLVCQIYMTCNTSKKWLADHFRVSPPAIHYILRTHSQFVGTA